MADNPDWPDVFATVEDLEARWHKLTDDEQAIAASKLADATDILKARCKDWERQPANRLARICCAMVKRSMQADVQNPNALSQFAQTAGPFSESGTYSNPNGDLYPLRSELKDLGVGKQKAYAVDMSTGGVVGR